MNIFYLDSSPRKAAQYHCDKHVVKMILEYAQLLSTAHRVLDGNNVGGKWVHPTLDDVLYKATHVNHPSSIWVREGWFNYMWLYDLFLNLGSEYAARYGKIHATSTKLENVLKTAPNNIPFAWTKLKPAVGREVSEDEDLVEVYREYYQTKSFLMTWKNLNPPEWYNSH